MLAADFRRKVRMIPAARLPEFLADDYLAFLPDDLDGGKVPTEQLIQDFITYRKHVEGTDEK